METIIQCKNLCHYYGKQKVLTDLNIEIQKGTILGLIGKNGAGKTTTINILMGFLQPASGSFSIMGEPSHALGPDVRQRIGLLHEGFLQYEFMTIEEAEKFYSPFYPNWRSDFYYNLIDKMGLRYNHKISKMSCGQRSQLTLGLIFAQCPELLILDDYSLGLDPGYRRLFIDYLKEHVKETGATVLVTSHIVQDLEKFIDDVIILHKGKALVESRLSTFMENFTQIVIPVDPENHVLRQDEIIFNYDIVGTKACIYSFAVEKDIKKHLAALGQSPNGCVKQEMTLEDAFIGITGKY